MAGESRLNPAAPEFYPTRTTNSNFQWNFIQLLPPPPLPSIPTPCYWSMPIGYQPYTPPVVFYRSKSHGGSNRRYVGGRRNPPPRSPRVRRSWRPRQRAITASEASTEDHAVYSRIIEHRDYQPTRFRKERPKMPLKPGNSTVMICNIPNKYTRKMLIDFLDEHCAKENKKLMDHLSGVISAYDFLYLPFDLRKLNLGYAFVNFTHPGAVERFQLSCHGKIWEHCGSRKICELAAADMQGKDELMKQFESAGFACVEEEFLPVCFSPPGRGLGLPVRQRTVGSLMNNARP